MAQARIVEEVPGTVAPAGRTMPHIDWAAVLAGAVVAATVAFVFGAFGAAVGLSLTDPFDGDAPGPIGVTIAIAIWILWVASTSSMAGAYVTGRMRRRAFDATEHESDVRDGIHGVVVWGVGTLLGALIFGSGITTGARIGADVAAAGAAAGTVAASEAADGPSGGLNAYLADTLFRRDGGAGEPVDPEARREAVRIFATEPAKAGDGTDIAAVSQDDRQYLASLVAARTGVSPDEAKSRVDAAVSRIEQAKQQARETADAARKAAIVAAFVLAASLLIAAAAAYWAAGLGGRHRDEQRVFARFGRWL